MYDSIGRTNKSYKLVFTPNIEKYNQSFELEWNPTLAVDYKKDIPDQKVDSTINIGGKSFNVSLDNEFVVAEEQLADGGSYAKAVENLQTEDGEQNFVAFLRFNADNQTISPNSDGEYSIQLTDSLDSADTTFSEDANNKFNGNTEPLIDWSKDPEIHIYREKKGAYPRQLVAKNIEQGIKDGKLTDVSDQFDIQIDNEKRVVNIQFPEGETDDSYTVVFSSDLTKEFDADAKGLGLIHILKARLPLGDQALKRRSGYNIFLRSPLDYDGSGKNQEPKPEQPKPEQPKPSQPKPDQPKPSQPKPDQPKPSQPKPDQPKPDQPKPSQPKPDQPKGGPTANQPSTAPVIIASDQYIALNKKVDLLKLAQAISGGHDISDRLKIDVKSLNGLPHTGDGTTITPTKEGQYAIRYYIKDRNGVVITERTVTIRNGNFIGADREPTVK